MTISSTPVFRRVESIGPKMRSKMTTFEKDSVLPIDEQLVFLSEAILYPQKNANALFQPSRALDHYFHLAKAFKYHLFLELR